ncbi:MAG TPA: hypothetical protein VGH30_12665 [Jatrophihabitantaceae bacterium]|jgi:hypothetical protein
MSTFVRLGHGLHRPAEHLTTLADRCGAYLDALPEGTVISGITAARLHGLWVPEAAETERLEFATARAETAGSTLARCRRNEIHPRRRALRPDEIDVTDRFALTSVARTWVDLAEFLSVEDLVAAGDSALRGDATVAELTDATTRAHRRRGVLRAREALQLLDGRSRSRPESHLRCIVVRAGLPYPRVNQAIYTANGEWLAEPDLSYPRARVALEYNGKDHADLERMRKDITREIDIDGNEWKVVVFGAREVFKTPYQIPPYLRGILDRRDPGWSRRPPDPR